MTLREAREAAGMTQVELAAKVNLQPSSISMYESGDRTPSLSVAYTLAGIFNTSIEALFPQIKTSRKVEETAHA